MLLHSRKLETCWVRLVTPTLKRALANAEQPLFDTNHTILDLIAPARPDPAPRMQHWIKHTQQIFLCLCLFDSLRLWLTPIVPMPLTRVCLRCRSSARGGGLRQQNRHFISALFADEMKDKDLNFKLGRRNQDVRIQSLVSRLNESLNDFFD
jgi:hypothetical protein